jgi:hypothetical protein
MENPVTEFYTDKYRKSGYTSKCKVCYKKYNVEHKLEKALYDKEYCKKHKEIRNKRSSDWAKAHRKEKALYDKQYRIKNRERSTITHRMINRIKRKTDPNFRLVENIRGRIKRAIKYGYGEKAHKTKELLGCDWEQIKKHLESQFTEGMSWDNYGEWHIDHIKPCASFDLTDPEQQKQCFHYTNLQPLWAEDNLKKGSKHAI